jgi:hypothetical protein
MEYEKPPVFAKWSSWYVLVLFTLAIQLLLFLWLTNLYS